MAEVTVPVDLLSPGQVFACLGLMEAAEILCGPAEGQFLYEANETGTRFRLSVPGVADPLRDILAFLAEAEAVALAPSGSNLEAKEKDVSTMQEHPGIYPCPQPDTPSALPAILVSSDRQRVPISHWVDGTHVGRDNVKFWAGAGGYSGAALARDALDAVGEVDLLNSAYADPFALAAPMTSSFRFDWRRDYIPIDIGFSLNDHTSTHVMNGYPLVELLAAIGLENARPQRIDKLTYRYAVSHSCLPTVLARAVLGGGAIGFPMRTFLMNLGWPGKEGQARCIRYALEEQNNE